MFVSGLNTASFYFESLNSSLDPFKKTITLFIYVFFNFKILWNIKLKLLTAKDKKYEITRWNDMCPAYWVCRVTSWNFERTPLDRSCIHTKKIVLIDVLHR